MAVHAGNYPKETGPQRWGGPAMSGDVFGGCTLPELVEQVGPVLKELDALRPITRPIVRLARLVLVLVGEGRLDYIPVKAPLVEDRAGRRAEAVRAHLLLAVAHPSERRVHGVFR